MILKIDLTIKITSLVICFLLLNLAMGVFADDGTYDATVTTDSGSYTVPVEVEDGEVTSVYWSHGGEMTVYGAEISDGEASGTNSKGDSIDITIDDYEEEAEQAEDEE